jgi:hypothetical protein
MKDLKENSLIVGGIYQHYKGGVYEILNIATHSETKEQLVVYKNIKDSEIWVRPKGMFFDSISVDGKLKLRFSCLRDRL